MKEVIVSSNAPKAIGPYSPAIRVGETVYLSGQIPLVPETMTLISDSFTEQAQQVLKNLAAMCEAAGGDFSHLVKLTIFLTDLTHFPILNELMMQKFREPYPARSTIQVAALPKNALIEIEGVMVFKA